MIVDFNQRLPASPDKVYAALMTPAVIQACIDGCESLAQTGENTYDAKMRVGGASMKGTVQLTSTTPPHALTLSILGKGLPGSVKATVGITLRAVGSETELLGSGDVTVGGFAAALGSKLIESGARTMLADFFAKLEAQLTSSGT